MEKTQHLQTDKENFLISYFDKLLEKRVYFYANKYSVLRLVDKKEWDCACKNWAKPILEGNPMAVSSQPLSFDICANCDKVCIKARYSKEHSDYVCGDCYC